MQQKINELLTELDNLLEKEDIETNEETKLSITLLKNRIEDLEKQRHHKCKLQAAANYEIEGEKITKYWSKTNREVKPRDMIYELEKPGTNPPEYEKHSDKMANIVKDFFDTLQKQPYNATKEEQGKIIEEVLDNVNDHELELTDLDEEISEEDINAALQLTENDKATGMDGIPYNFYKCLNCTFKADSKAENAKEEELFDIIEALTMVYQDIEKHGTDPDSENKFAEGWICPLYKKDDPRKPSNYRPITLLNCDYKIYTKALTMKLAKHAPALIHKNQAGFVPKRSIFDHVQLSKFMIHYAEATEENGVLIALDQEKAYDRIAHDYLWKALERNKIPTRFINAVKALYNNASSIVILNGEHSEKFQITRGVRQGDPLSCLLFNLAIEPLAEMLRRSDLEGYQIPGARERLITTLFADDTTVYLTAGDSITVLEEILEKWCKASGAKFNLDKTEVIPIETPEYRERVLETRIMNPATGERIPDHMKLARDGKPVRSLGAWIGNKIDQATPWTKTIEKMSAALERWKKCSPTLRGKRLIAQMIVGGMTQYLTKVQGMPKAVETQITKILRNFIWDGKKPPISIERLSKPIEEGSIKLLDIQARNEAIEITWLKAYLNLSESRPVWAFVAEVLIGLHITKGSGGVHKLSQVNTFLQTWKVNMTGASRLPEDIKRMLRIAKKHNLTCNAIKIDRKIKKALPIWYHIGARKSIKSLINSTSGKCLRENHQVVTVGDLLKIRERMRRTTEPPHKPYKNCPCPYCDRDRRVADCDNPSRCTNTAIKLLRSLKSKWNTKSSQPKDNLSLTENRMKENMKAKEEGRQITFDPTTTLRDEVLRLFRVFTDPEIPATRPSYRPPRGAEVEEESTEAHIESSQRKRKNKEPRSSCGIRLERGIAVTSIRARIAPTSKQAADLTAMLIAIQNTPDFAPLHLKTTSTSLVKTFTADVLNLEKAGWFGIKNTPLIRAVTARLRKRSARTTLQWISKKKLGPENHEAKKIAQSALSNDEINSPDMSIPKEFNLTGAELSTLSQASAYAAIREMKKTKHTETTENNVRRIMNTIQQLTGQPPEAEKIWKQLRNEAIKRLISDFLWKMIHNVHKVGKYWKNLPGYEERSKCNKCDTLESIEHILFECKETGQQEVWELTKELWGKTGHDWPGQNLATVTAGGLLQFESPPPPEDGEKKKKWRDGRQRLLMIILSESAYLIWKLRNKRRIRNEENPDFEHTRREISNRWYKTLDNRLTLDRAMANPAKFAKKALDPDLVRRTWGGVLKNKRNLPKDWIREGEVLVGRGHSNG